MQNKLYPSQRLENSKEGYFSKNLKTKNYTYLVIISFLIFTVFCLPFIKFRITIQNQGIIRPNVEKSEIKSPVFGFIEKNYKTNNSKVEIGDVILTIKTDQFSDKIRFLKKKVILTKLNITDINLLIAEFPAIDGFLNLKSEVYLSQYKQFRNNLKKILLSENQTKKELKRLKQLLSKKMTSDLKVETKNNKLRQISSDEKILKSDYFNKWQTALRDEREKLTELNI